MPLSTRHFYRAISTALLLLTLLSPSPLCGWWDGGHMTVAQIAYWELTPEAREKVDALAAMYESEYPEYANPIALATWMDALRGQDFCLFDTWHYTTIPYDPEGLLSIADRAEIEAWNGGRDAVWALNVADYILSSDKTTDQQKAFMLAAALHIIADIHQPLHTTSKYSEEHPHGDRGGNYTPVPWSDDRLHAYWDSGFGRFPNVRGPFSAQDYQAIADFALDIMMDYPRDSLVAVGNGDPMIWALESHNLAETVAYNFPDGEAAEAQYLETAYPIACERIALAGYRLANLLNRAFSHCNEEVESGSTATRTTTTSAAG